MATDTQATVTIKANVDNLLSGLRKAGASLTDFEKHGQKLSRGFKDFFSGFGLAQLSAAGAGAALTLLVKNSLTAASSLEAMERRAKAVYGDSFPRMRDEAEKLAAAVGRSGSDILEFQQGFANVAAGLNLPRQMMEDMSVELTKLTVDFGSFFNMTDEDSFQIIQGGLLGMTRGLQRYGIVLNDATLQEYANSRGVKTKLSDLGEAQQAFLRYNFILDKTNQLQGDATENADSYGNSIKRLSGAWVDFKESVGQGLAPAAAASLEAIAGGIRNITAALAQWNAQIGETYQFKLAEERSAAEGGTTKKTEWGWVTDYTKPGFRDQKGSLAVAAGTMTVVNQEAKAAAKSTVDLNKELTKINDKNNKNNKTSDSLKQLLETMKDLGRTYQDASRSIGQNLKQLELDHKEKMKSFAEQINDATTSLQRLREEFQRTNEGFDRQEIDKTADQLEKIAKLKEQLSEERGKAAEQYGLYGVDALGVSTSKTMAIEQQIAREEAALRSASNAKPGLLANATAEGAKTDYQRDLEDIKRRREEEKRQFDERYGDQQRDIEKTKEKRREEELTYGALRQQYANTQASLASFYADYTTKLADMRTVTEETAKAMKQALEDIRNSISTTDALATGSSTIGESVAARRQARQNAAGLPAFAEGGIVTRPTVALVGEAGPEAIVPLGKKGMVSSVNFGPFYISKEVDSDAVIQKITRAIQLQQLSAT